VSTSVGVSVERDSEVPSIVEIPRPTRALLIRLTTYY